LSQRGSVGPKGRARARHLDRWSINPGEQRHSLAAWQPIDVRNVDTFVSALGRGRAMIEIAVMADAIGDAANNIVFARV
jgi:hypothetical protein